MANTRSKKRSRVAAIDEKEEENTLAEGYDQSHAVKRRYVTDRNALLRKLMPGDHIAAERKSGMCDFEHHGIYEGTERGYPSVVHFQGPIRSLVKGSVPLSCIFDCGYIHPKDGGKVISCIDCFSQGMNMFKMQYMLQCYLFSDQDSMGSQLKPGKVIAGYRSKKYYLEHFLDGELYGHSSYSMDKYSKKYTVDAQVKFYQISSHRSAEHVLDVACLVRFRPYSLGCNNCEHFAVFCKTGMTRSIQVEKSRLRVVCEDGKQVCRFRARDLTSADKGRQNLNLQELRSPEPKQAMEVGEQGEEDEEEKELLKSFEGVKKRKITS